MDTTSAVLRLAAALTAALTATGSATTGPAATWPVTPTSVIRPFDTATGFGPGHRGVDLHAAGGQPVRAPLDGRVAHAGPVAGRGVLALSHPGGLRTTYLPVQPLVQVGQRVSRGQVVAVVAAPEHCAEACLHWGAKRDGAYVDPQSLLSQQVVLLPQ